MEQRKVIPAVLSEFLTQRIREGNKCLFYITMLLGGICNAARVTGRVPIYLFQRFKL